MDNVFYKVEEEIFFDETIIFDELKIRDYLFNYIFHKLNSVDEKEKAFVFQNIVYDFFRYRNIEVLEAKKTRDFGLDGIVKFKLDFLGELNLGLQIKNKLIDSNDVDLFVSALKNSEIQLGVLVCKDSRRLDKYELNSKIKAILFSKGITLKEKLINDKVNVNPVLILKLNDMIEIASSEMRCAIRGIYKK